MQVSWLEVDVLFLSQCWVPNVYCGDAHTHTFSSHLNLIDGTDIIRVSLDLFFPFNHTSASTRLCKMSQRRGYDPYYYDILMWWSHR